MVIFSPEDQLTPENKILNYIIYLFFFNCRHAAVDMEPKTKDQESIKANLYPPYPPISNEPSRSHSQLPNDVTRSEPNLIGSEPEPVILKSVPSLKNLSENCLSNKSKTNSKSNVNHQKLTLLQSKSVAVDNRPIYPNCPFSPYASPTNSPRSNRKRQPFKESRRVSIEKTGMYIQLNQYKLMDSIGQVSLFKKNINSS